MHGAGRLDSVRGTYDGQFEDGLCHGRGAMSYSDIGVEDGDLSYEGQYVRGKREGVGALRTFLPAGKGTSSAGQWVGGKRHGVGKQTWLSGNVYMGQWVGGRQHGVGGREVDLRLFARDGSHRLHEQLRP